MAKPKKTPEESADDNERTNSMGLFNTAEAYWRGAQALAAAKVPGGFADSPVRTLYYHAIELYLKALLRQHYSVDDLQIKFRHSIKRMRAKAERHGLSLMDEDREVLALMKGDILIRARYTRTGYGTFPTIEALDRTCMSLRESVGTLLRKAGVLVRR
jgi:HEPN domain-containing protein